jgi:hypothetical protein
VESRVPELRLQCDVGDGSVAEHPATRVAHACRGSPEPVGRRGGEPVTRAAAVGLADMRFADMRFADIRFADMRLADVRPADVGPSDVRPADMRLADMRLADMRLADVRPAAAVTAATVSATTMPAATAAGVCFECEKRHDEEQHRGQASAGRQH